MSYSLRNDRGILIAKVDNDTAGMMLRSAAGEWTEKTFKPPVGKKTVFVFQDARVLDGRSRNASWMLFIWKGYYLETAP